MAKKGKQLIKLVLDQMSQIICSLQFRNVILKISGIPYVPLQALYPFQFINSFVSAVSVAKDGNLHCDFKNVFQRRGLILVSQESFFEPFYFNQHDDLVLKQPDLLQHCARSGFRKWRCCCPLEGLLSLGQHRMDLPGKVYLSPVSETH